MSAWIRYTGIQQTGALRAFPISVIARGDSTHIQPFVILNEPNMKPAISCNVAGTAHKFILPVAAYNFNYWAKFTLTYTTTGTVSLSQFYINGTLISNWTGAGKLMRWSDSSTLVIGEESCNIQHLVLRMWTIITIYYNHSASFIEITAVSSLHNVSINLTHDCNINNLCWDIIIILSQWHPSSEINLMKSYCRWISFFCHEFVYQESIPRMDRWSCLL